MKNLNFIASVIVCVVLIITVGNFVVANSKDKYVYDGLYRWSSPIYYCFNLKTKKYYECEEKKWVREGKGFALCHHGDTVALCLKQKKREL